MAARKLLITFADGHTAEVQPNLEDRLKFETTLRKNKGWGPLSDNSLKLHPFLAWSAAQRTGVTDLTWDQFTSGPTAALDVDIVDEDADAGLEVEGLGEGTPTADTNTSPSSSD